jgi:hypothetical protein
MKLQKVLAEQYIRYKHPLIPRLMMTVRDIDKMVDQV